MLEEQLEKSVIAVGESLLFQALERKPPSTESTYYYATSEVSSPLRFALFVGTPEASAKAIAKVLYDDPNVFDSPATLKDIVAELANTIAGTLARSVSEELSLELSPPASSHGSLPRVASTCMGFSGDAVELVVSLTLL